MASSDQDYQGQYFSAPELRDQVDWPEAVINDYVAKDKYAFSLRPTFGQGSPETFVAAGPGGLYFNETDSTLWINKTAGSKTGWVKVSV